MEILKYYLTSLEPNISQDILSQSIGGYCSTSLIYPETTLSGNIGIYDTSIILDTPSSGSWSDWTNIEFINIGNELIKISPLVDGTITVLERGYNDIFNMHLDGDIVRAASANLIFNDVFNSDFKQYRCLTIKNMSSIINPSLIYQTADNVVMYLEKNSSNSDSSIKISVEKPKSQYISGRSSSWTVITLVDDSLAGSYSDNYFAESYLMINSGDAKGQGKIIQSYDGTTGTFTFYSSFSSLYNFDENVDYYVESAPSQRVLNGTVSPEVSTERVTAFSSPVRGTAIGIYSDNNSSIFLSESIKPNEVIYLWIERTVSKGKREFNNNDFVFNIKYTLE